LAESIQKWCPECGEWQTLDEFFVARRASDGRTSYCKPCLTRRNNESKARRARGELIEQRRPRRTVQSVVPYKTCPRCERRFPLEGFAINRTRSRGISAYCLACHNEIVRVNRVKNHGSTRNYHLKERYDLTEQQVAEMVEAQGGKCAICRRKDAEHVDHDHATGRIRGILCFTCNVGLGNFNDGPHLMTLAHEYLTYDPESAAIVAARLRLLLRSVS
jgi:hypothetical protein